MPAKLQSKKTERNIRIEWIMKLDGKVIIRRRIGVRPADPEAYFADERLSLEAIIIRRADWQNGYVCVAITKINYVDCQLSGQPVSTYAVWVGVLNRLPDRRVKQILVGDIHVDHLSVIQAWRPGMEDAVHIAGGGDIPILRRRIEGQ